MDLLSQKDFQVEISTRLDDPHWDKFVSSVKGGDHVQTSSWSQVKALLDWSVLRIKIMKREEIVAGAQMLIHSYPMIGAVGYVTKGPLGDYENTGQMQLLVDEILAVSRKQHVNALAIQPPQGGEAVTSLFKARHFRSSPLELAPVATLMIDLQKGKDTLLAGTTRQTRQNIRKGERSGMVARVGSQEDIDRFYTLHMSTGQRQNFLPYPKSYFEMLWQVFSKQDAIQFIFVEYNDQPVSALLLITFQDTVHAKLLGWSGEYREMRPNDVLFWESIAWSVDHGYRYFDFEGVDPQGARHILESGELTEEVRHSPDFIKYGFGGKLVMLPGAYDRVFNPFFRTIYNRLPLEVNGHNHLSHVMDYLRKR